jgi:hypothetical protein
MAKFGKKNKVSLNPLDANICLLGLPKIGKTTIMKEIAEKLVGEDGYLFLEMYRENGAKYIEDIVYEDVPEWDNFVEIIDDIVDNRTTDYADLKVVFLDTLDNAIQLAEQESIRLWNKENPQKRTSAINAAWGGFMKGQDKAMELLQEQLFRLRSVGVAFSVIGHVRQTTITDPITGESYQQITSDVSQRYFNQLKKNIDLVGIAYIDREIVKNKANGKEILTVKSETRKIKFRDDNYTVDSGSRMSQIVNEIDFDADEFIKAMKDALEAEVKKGGKSVEDRKKENEKDEAEALKRIAEAEVKTKTEKSIDEVKGKIVEFFVKNKTDIDALKPALEICKKHGYSNPKDIDDLDVAKEVLGACK